MKNYGKDYRGGGTQYEYIGEWYETQLPVEYLKKEAGRLWLYLTGMSALFLTGLSLNNAGSRIFQILIPFTCLFLPIIYGWMGSVSLYRIAERLTKAAAEKLPGDRKNRAETESRTDGRKSGDRRTGKTEPQVEIPPEHRMHLRRSEYEQAFRRLHQCSIASSVLAASALVCDGITLFRSGGQTELIQELLFAGAAAGMLILAIFWMRSARKLKAGIHKIV